MQDKKALEDRLKEVQTILETVQNQRNELRQLYKVGPDLAPMPWSCLSLLHAWQAALRNLNGAANGCSLLVCMCPGARCPQHRCLVDVLCFEVCVVLIIHAEDGRSTVLEIAAAGGASHPGGHRDPAGSCRARG